MSGTDDSAPLPDFKGAFEAARAQHSGGGGNTDDEHASDAEESTEEDETAEGDDKDEDGAADEADGDKGETADAEDTETSDLISDKEFQALQTEHGTDAAKLRQALNKVFTQKTQALSGDKKIAARVKPYLDLIDAFDENPEGTIEGLAKQYGFDVTKKAEGDGEKKEATKTAEEVTSEMLTEFKTALGPDLEYLAESLGPAMLKMVERLTQGTVEKATAPLVEGQKRLTMKEAEETTAATMKVFSDTHPDWQEHEEAMMEIAKTLNPNGLSEDKYLERLYQLATRDTWEADREKSVASEVKKALGQMEKKAKGTDTKTRATSDNLVTTAAPATPSIREAFDAAKRGERWEHR